MTTKTFNHLSTIEQQRLILEQGTFLADREEGPFYIMLYELDNTYIEVQLLKNSNKASKIKILPSTEDLSPYLEQIDLTNLFQEIF